MANIECNIYSNKNILGGSMRMNYQGNSYIKSKIKVVDAQSLSILQHCSATKEYVQLIIKDKDKQKKYVADCSVIDISTKDYNPLDKYPVLFGVETIREV